MTEPFANPEPATPSPYSGVYEVVGQRDGLYYRPVNALDKALRSAVTSLHPELEPLELIDYKVRILEKSDADTSGTASVTRVLVSTSDGKREWTTLGVHENVIAASWRALEDALTYGLMRSQA